MTEIQLLRPAGLVESPAFSHVAYRPAGCHDDLRRRPERRRPERRARRRRRRGRPDHEGHGEPGRGAGRGRRRDPGPHQRHGGPGGGRRRSAGVRRRRTVARRRDDPSAGQRPARLRARRPGRARGGVRRCRRGACGDHEWSPPEVRRVSRTPGTHLAALPSLAGRASTASLRRFAMHAPGARATPDELPAATTSVPRAEFARLVVVPVRASQGGGVTADWASP